MLLHEQEYRNAGKSYEWRHETFAMPGNKQRQSWRQSYLTGVQNVTANDQLAMHLL